MNQIPEHPKHHKSSMIGAGLILGYAIVPGQIDALKAIPSWVFPVTGIIAFVAWFLVRTMVSYCPECRKRMKHSQSMTANEQQWEVFQCQKCNKNWRVPGISLDG